MVYFRNLDGLRFIAAFFVIIGHCQHILFDLPSKPRVYSPWAEKMAGFGVDFFFVLSGFLISYWLIKELALTQTINIKNFYIRRALRLWPLYFIVGIIGLLTAHPILSWMKLLSAESLNIAQIINNFLYLLTFTINFQTLLGKMNEYSSLVLGHFWSLAVEEQFYLIWAPFLLLFRKKIGISIAIMIGIGFTTTLFQPAIFTSWFGENAWASPIFFPTNRFFHFGLGALLAWLVYHQKLMYLPPFVSWVSQIAFILPVFTYLFGWHFKALDQERIIHGLISFGIILMAITPHSLFFFESKWMKYFGKVSFGIYIFHLFAIRLSFKLLTDISLDPLHIYFQVIFPLLSATIAILLAVLSYEKLEQPFLKLKDKF
jgi:peptidoglycan/LPS O-acetylase OafA/YrhL